MRIINVTSNTNAYVIIRNLNLKPGASGTIDVDILVLSELKSLRNLYLANDIIISQNDFNYIVEKIATLSGGGTASYPSFTGNADKVLTVTSTEDGVEWTTAATQVYVDTQDGLLQDQINLKADAIAVNQVLSNKADLVGGVIPSSQLPSYVDDVLNFTDLASFPSLGEDSKIYVAEDVNKTYRWGGSSYVEIGGGGVALGETSSTAYRGDNGKIAYDHSQSQGNPHNTTTSDISEGTKLFFTEDRVNQTVLTGLDTSTATPVLATDQILAAIGKLQAQINNMINTPSYPSFTGNAGKVLVVNATEDGVEWVTLPSGGSEIPSDEMHFTTLAGSVDYVGTQGDQILLSDNSIVDITATDETVTFDVPSGKHKVKLVESVGRHNYVSVGGEALVELHNFPTLSTVTKFNFSTYEYNALPNLTKVPNFLPSNITDMSYVFYNATSFNQPLNNWNVSNVTYMYYMFVNATSFNQPLNNWNVSNVTDMRGMFVNASAFNQDLNNWNVSNVTDMSSMFVNASAFNQDLNNWNVSNVTDMSSMFFDATSFNQDLSQWCVSEIASLPYEFDLNAINWTLPRPVWGTCPAP